MIILAAVPAGGTLLVRVKLALTKTLVSRWLFNCMFVTLAEPVVSL